jgi:hypothetical protein
MEPPPEKPSKFAEFISKAGSKTKEIWQETTQAMSKEYEKIKQSKSENKTTFS